MGRNFLAVFDYGIPVEGDAALFASLVKACWTEHTSRAAHDFEPQFIGGALHHRLPDTAVSAELNDSREAFQDTFDGCSYAHVNHVFVAVRGCL